MDDFKKSLEDLVKTFVDQGYTEEMATEIVNKMFGGFGVEVK